MFLKSDILVDSNNLIIIIFERPTYFSNDLIYPLATLLMLVTLLYPLDRPTSKTHTLYVVNTGILVLITALYTFLADMFV